MLCIVYLFAHVLICSFVILSVTATPEIFPNCTKTKHPVPNGDPGKKKEFWVKLRSKLYNMFPNLVIFFIFFQHIVYYRECLEPNTGCCNIANQAHNVYQIHQHCECGFGPTNNVGETYCSEKCTEDLNCKGYMQRNDRPDLTCAIVTSGDCDVFSDLGNGVYCVLEKELNVGDLLPKSTCEFNAWSGCYIKYGKLRVDINL